MKHLVIALWVCCLLSPFALTSALAQDGPTRNGNNCAGIMVSGLAGPGFGALAAASAHQQLVDNFGLASCGDNPRRNP